VGTVVDVVGQTGSPRQISVFQELDTFGFIRAGQREELTDSMWELVSLILEGFVLIRKEVMNVRIE
jgi:hypothetical protein